MICFAHRLFTYSDMRRVIQGRDVLLTPVAAEKVKSIAATAMITSTFNHYNGHDLHIA